MADLHGCYELYSAMIDWCFNQDQDCTVIICGDACDRGPNGYKIMRELLDNPQVVYLKGNHEDMFVKAALFLCGYYADTDEHYNFLHSKKTQDQALDLLAPVPVAFATNLYFANGGLDTMVDWLMDGADENFVDAIENLPLTFSYNNLDFCHAGSTYDYFKKVADAEYNGTMPDPEAVQRLLWDRNLLALGWETGRIGIFGHTPVVSLPSGIYGRDKSLAHMHPCFWQDKMGAKDKRGGYKIDMDTGMVWSHKAYVLNCLTFKIVEFYDKGDGLIEITDRGKIIKEVSAY